MLNTKRHCDPALAGEAISHQKKRIADTKMRLLLREMLIAMTYCKQKIKY